MGTGTIAKRRTLQDDCCRQGKNETGLQTCSKYVASYTFVARRLEVSVLVPPATTIPTLSSVISRLTQSLSDLTTSRANVMSSLSSLAEERSQLDVREAEMREMVRKAEEKRSWFVAFKDWVESVATFLDEKVRMQSLRR
jgi:hypothetical protein